MAKPAQVSQYGGGAAPLTPQQGYGTPPPPEEVDHFHIYADTDARPQSLHHTLGAMPTQASPGNHLHDGGTSPLLLQGHTITGSKTDGTAVASMIQALVRLGADDQST